MTFVRSSAPIRRAFTALLLATLVTAADCKKPETSRQSGQPGKNGPQQSFADARRGFQSRLTKQLRDGQPAPVPPANSGLKLVKYTSPAGPMSAYLSTIPAGGAPKPAIVWLFGGFDNGIGDTAWEPADPSNDQSAAAFRKAGVVTMYPSLRGGNDSPGYKEGFAGEVDDVLATAEFLAKQPGVDPNRIYLGGHSTGGTLALLAAAAAPPGRFRAVFSFGPVADPAGYGEEYVNHDPADQREATLRAPINWLASIKSPTFVIEGAQRGNGAALQEIKRAAGEDSPIKCYPVTYGNHFNILGPMCQKIAGRIVKDTGPTSNIAFTEGEMVVSR